MLSIFEDSSALLQIIQTLNYKDVEVLRYEMRAADEEIVRQHVSYVYGAKRALLSMSDSRVKDISELVKLKNPQLLLHIQKILTESNSTQGAINSGSIHGG